MIKYIVYLFLITVCYSASTDKINSLVERKCKEYEDEYETVDKSNLQEEDTWYPYVPEGTSSVIGGTDSFPGATPYMVSLGYTTDNKIDWVCGGSLINEQYVLTAAHCLKKYTQSGIQEVSVARLGVTKLTATYASYPKDLKIIKTLAHPSYEPPSKYYDIGIVQLERSIKITKYIQPICLYTEKIFPEYSSIFAYGWGFTRPTGSPSEILQRVELELYEVKKCNETFTMSSSRILKNGIDADKQICLGSNYYRPSDTCQGDSGGPVTLYISDSDGNGSIVLVGVTSFGKSCGHLEIPAVYTRVSYYVPWITSIVWPNEK